MSKFLIEVEQLDENDQIVLSIGNADEEGEMYCSTILTEIEDDEMIMDSVGLASHTMEWDELAEFLISYAPEDFIPKMLERVIRERDDFESRLTDMIMDKE